MKNIFKYILLLVVNFLILMGLMNFWIDRFELALNQNIQFNETLKIIGFSFLSLIALIILFRIFKKRQVHQIKQKLKYSIVLMMLVCSYLYIGYSVKIINNRLINSNLRTELLSHAVIHNLGGTTWVNTQNLTLREYRQFKRSLDLPRLNRNAFNIELDYNDTGTLKHEFLKEITYSLPTNVEIKEYEYQENRKDYKKSQIVEQLAGVQRVTFIEEWW